MKRTTTDDLRTIVPATQPAWLHIEARWTCEDEDGTKLEEWGDAVVPVLAYATAPGGFGAWLICHNSDGPIWLKGSSSSDVRIRLVLEQKPKFDPDNCPFSLDGKYTNDDVFECFAFDDAFIWHPQ